jgi:predicted TIM-barrel fold metal-dependent hydrolase
MRINRGQITGGFPPDCENRGHCAATGLSRRSFIGSLAALGTTPMLLGPGEGLAQGAAPTPTGADANAGVIDVHHHLMPPKYLEVARAAILKVSAIPQVVDWTIARSLEDMDQNGVRTAILSISTPGVMFGSVEASRRLARECNEYAAKMVSDYPGRFGFFAAVPLPYQDGSLREIEYALDTLHADGAGLLSNYEGKYLGDAAFAAVFEELQRRKAIVYSHPTFLSCCMDVVTGVHVSTEEFGFDTTRTISSLLYSGTLSRCPDIRFIFSHGGGTLPFLAGRIGGASNRASSLIPHGADYEFRKLHFDTASVTNAPAMAAVLKLVPARQVMFGTDYPWRGAGGSLHELRSLGLSEGDSQAIEHQSALALFPRLRIARENSPQTVPRSG